MVARLPRNVWTVLAERMQAENIPQAVIARVLGLSRQSVAQHLGPAPKSGFSWKRAAPLLKNGHSIADVARRMDVSERFLRAMVDLKEGPGWLAKHRSERAIRRLEDVLRLHIQHGGELTTASLGHPLYTRVRRLGGLKYWRDRLTGQ